MPEHIATYPAPVYLSLWDETQTIDSGCTFFYYNDVIVNSVAPDHISIHAHDNLPEPVEVEVRGLHFREDDPAGNSLQVRIGE